MSEWKIHHRNIGMIQYFHYYDMYNLLYCLVEGLKTYYYVNECQRAFDKIYRLFLDLKKIQKTPKTLEKDLFITY